MGHRLLSGESRRTHTASHQRSGQARGSPDWPAPAKRKRGDRLSSSDEQRLDGLVSPIAVKRIDWQRNLVQVELTQQQVKESPNVDTDKPVSRQHEADFFDYYGYPYYWTGPAEFLGRIGVLGIR